MSGLDPLHGHLRVASGGLVSAGSRVHSQSGQIVQGEPLSGDRFTKVALEHLAKQKAIKLAENRYLMLGGTEPEAQKEIANATTKALQKFRAWADLVHEVVQTEFPDFELLAAFSVFWLDESMAGTAKRAPHSRSF